MGIGFFATEAALAVALMWGWFGVAALLILLTAHLMHAQLNAFHEAAHGMLLPNRRLNDLAGTSIGLFSFMSLSLYRAAHRTHHAWLATERDEELWPFVVPGTPRWARRLAAFVELNAGLLFTPFLFLRSFLRAGSPIRSRRVRRQIWAELAFIATVWIGVVMAATVWGGWKFLVGMYLVPAFLTGNMQSWRKYIEHVGLSGSTPTASTRSIVAPHPLGRLAAFTLLNQPFHGVHHQNPRLPYSRLPAFASCLAPTRSEDLPPFASYAQALAHLLRSLRDPRVGAQWLDAKPERELSR